MRVYRDLNTLPIFKNAVITIGTFDGVHAGHCQVIAQLKEQAAKIDGETVIITFDPHPRKIIAKGKGEISLLTTLDERIELLSKAGIENLVIVGFNQTFANQTAEQYIKDFLYQYFKPHTIIIGYDHRFGKGRLGDYHLMDHYGDILGFEVKETSEQVKNEVIVSSTRIRNALLSSDLATANSLLGYNYFFEGTVIHGNQLGHTIGYPTANLHIESEEKLIPGNGVYTVEVSLIKEKNNSELLTSSIPAAPVSIRLYNGMMNIGVRPTIDGKMRVIEVNIFDFDEDIYGQTLRVYVKHYLRGEIKFNGLDELKQQLLLDKEQAMKILKD
jgi:riboflavin kinase/FMN adenylyltransferase